MAARGDITAGQVFQDRQMLNRLGYGIFDVAWGKDWIGSENVRDFTYVVEPDIDPKIYRHKVYEVIGRYFNNDLAKELWYKFLQHKLEMSAAAGQEIELKQAALDWFTTNSYPYLKEWVFKQRQIPERIRDQPEPSRSWTAVSLGLLLPGLGELVKAGFTIPAIIGATLRATLPLRKKATITKNFGTTKIIPPKLSPSSVSSRKRGRFYMRVVGQLIGYPVRTVQEARQQWSEILAHWAYLNKQSELPTSLQAATLDYYRRLAFLEAVERGYECFGG
jgi:hypothetical protein